MSFLLKELKNNRNGVWGSKLWKMWCCESTANNQMQQTERQTDDRQRETERCK